MRPGSLRLLLTAVRMLAAAASAAFNSRAPLHLENLALRHQLSVLRRSVKCPKLTSADSYGRGCARFGSTGDLPWSSSNRKPSLSGTARASSCSGLGKFVTANPGGHGVDGSTPTDSQDEPRESAMGRAPHPRRIAQTRHRYRRGHP